MNLRFTLAASIYPPHCLEDARAAFASICSVKVIQENHLGCEIEITPLNDETAESQVAPEFLNYLLDLSAAYHLGLTEEAYGTDKV